MGKNAKMGKVKRVMHAMIKHAWEHGTAAQALIEAGDHELALLMVHEEVSRQTAISQRRWLIRIMAEASSYRLEPHAKMRAGIQFGCCPFEGAFVGVFRADHKHGKPQRHLGRSQDALHWDIEDEEIHWVDEAGLPYQPDYS